MEFRILGPLEVRDDGVALPLGTRKQQIALAVLIVNAGRVVALADLVDELWPQAPPASAVANARGYVARLRRLFESVEPGRDRLRHNAGGYLLRLEPAELDLSVFAAHAAAGRDESRRDEPARAATRFAAALACWRGRMLDGLGDGPILGPRSAAAADERLAVIEELAQARLASDQPGEAVALMREHVRSHPLRERGHLLLMRALYLVGDVAGALAAYADCRAALKEELGVEPGPQLQDLHRSMLDRDAAAELPARPAAAPSPVAARPVPAQLPLDVYGFAGRDAELARLDAILSAGQDHPTAVVISAIAGTAGVGKTATAVHWAHRLREEFPDGQLYVNLRGFDPTGSPVQPAEAVRGFLDAFDVPPGRIPADLPAQVALYRSLVTGRRVLIVLDNARDAEQVRPLLPGSPGCLVVVTSRNQLPGLTAVEGAHPVTLDLLTADEARALLIRRLGVERVATEPDAVNEIITRCARLPLALAITAARAATRPGFPLETLAAELRDASGGLDALVAGGPTTDVRVVFSWSYRAVSKPAARLFRLLGLHAGPDIGLPAAASFAGLPREKARPLLAELTRAHLLTEPVPGRYTFHDLLRAYAAELAHAIDPEPDRHAAIHRILDHYLHTANKAAQALDPHYSAVDLAAALPGVNPENPAGVDAAVAWFTAEHRVLLAAIAQAARTGFDKHALQLATPAGGYLRGQGHYADLLVACHNAMKAARRLEDRRAQASVHHGLAVAYGFLRRYDDAHTHLNHRQDLLEALGDRLTQVDVHVVRAWLTRQRGGRLEDVLDHAQRALNLAQTMGDRLREAKSLTYVAWYKAMLGDHGEAVILFRQAIAIQQQAGDRFFESSAWDGLGFAHHGLGHHSEALICYKRALELYELIGERPEAAQSLDRLGDTYLALGDADAAAAAWRQALTLLDELGQSDADTVRAKLCDLHQA